MAVLRMLQKFMDGMNNCDFDPADLLLGLCGVTILVIWLKALTALWECSLLSMVP